MIGNLQANFNDEKLLNSNLVNPDNRYQNLQELQDSFREMNGLITDQETFQQRNQKLLSEYTQMVDIGT